MKFLCDVMLARVARWLRAAGYDTELAEAKVLDKELLARAIKEERLLISRDRHFLVMKEAMGNLIYLSGNRVSDCLKELNQKVEIDWLYRPFSRCLLCNSLVEPAEFLPATVYRYCKKCNKVYWKGSHTKRMLQTLSNLGTLK